MIEKLLYKIHVKGRVQGVGFRWNAAREAKSLGLKGYIKNLPDGRVYIEAEGTHEQLDIFLGWCRKGPQFSFVESVESGSFPAVDYTEFSIEH